MKKCKRERDRERDRERERGREGGREGGRERERERERERRKILKIYDRIKERSEKVIHLGSFSGQSHSYNSTIRSEQVDYISVFSNPKSKSVWQAKAIFSIVVITVESVDYISVFLNSNLMLTGKWY
jgi:hypothetical protein